MGLDMVHLDGTAHMRIDHITQDCAPDSLVAVEPEFATSWLDRVLNSSASESFHRWLRIGSPVVLELKKLLFCVIGSTILCTFLYAAILIGGAVILAMVYVLYFIFNLA